MAPSYRILITSLDAYGHINCVLSLGELLKERGHEIIFSNRQHNEALAKKRGFKFIPFDEEIFKGLPENYFTKWAENTKKYAFLDSKNRYKNWTQKDKEDYEVARVHMITEAAVAKVLADVEVDLVISDTVFDYPCLLNSKTPFIPLVSMNPIMIYLNAPPLFSGYPVNVDEETAQEYRRDFADAMSEFKGKFDDWWKANNVPPSPYPLFYQTKPKYFGLYHCPAALDYVECGPRTGDWIRVDQAVRQADDDDFVLPAVLANKPGKLIYFSLGSIGSIDLELMNRLLGILSRSPHRFIVSKGPRGDEINLPENMWGENYVNQIKILPIVDLVITHGGHNTTMETLYYAKPLIVIPIFLDQLDNAQRVVEKNIGRRVDLWAIDDDNLLQAIEESLADEEMKRRLKEISEAMKTSDSRTKAAELIEDLIGKTQKEASPTLSSGLQKR